MTHQAAVGGAGFRRAHPVLYRQPEIRYNPVGCNPAPVRRPVRKTLTTEAGSNHMEVQSTGSVGAALPVQYTRPASGGDQVAALPMTPTDEVEISEVSKMLNDALGTPGVREQKLAQIKAAIDAGVYETPEKLDQALSRMLDQISHELNETR